MEICSSEVYWGIFLGTLVRTWGKPNCADGEIEWGLRKTHGKLWRCPELEKGSVTRCRLHTERAITFGGATPFGWGMLDEGFNHKVSLAGSPNFLGNRCLSPMVGNTASSTGGQWRYWSSALSSQDHAKQVGPYGEKCGNPAWKGHTHACVRTFLETCYCDQLSNNISWLPARQPSILVHPLRILIESILKH